MGDSVENYRAAIGLFNCKRNRKCSFSKTNSYSFTNIILINLQCFFLTAQLSILQSVNPKIDIVFLLFVLHFILIMGTVETNPGPLNHLNLQTNSDNPTLRENVSILSLNIRSVRNKLEFLDNFCDEFDILTLSETHLNPNISDEEIKLDSFSEKILRKDRNSFGGGILIYAKNDIGFERKLELENPIDEIIWVEIHAKGNNFLLCHAYRPPNYDSDFWTRYSHAIGLAIHINQNIVLTGDLNCDLLTNQNNNKLTDIMNLYNLTNVIEKPTRITDRSQTLLDPILISDTLSSIFADVLKVARCISDHDAPIVFLDCPNLTKTAYKREIWLYDQVDKNKMSEKLQETYWNALLSDDQNIDEMCVKFNELF